MGDFIGKNRMTFIRSLVLVLFMATAASAQVRPGIFTTLRTTNTGAASVCVGCPVGSSTPAGGITATTGSFNGNVTWATDATYDLGASGATRPRDFFLSRNATIGGLLTVNSSAIISASTTTDGTSIATFRRSDARNSVIINNATTAALGGAQVLDVGASAAGIAAVFAGALGIGTGSPDAHSLLDIVSTTLATKPFPRMTTTQRDAIASPTQGMFIYNTTTNRLNVYTNAWEAIASAP